MDVDALIGTIMLFPYNFTPSGWHKCDGTVLTITQYQALFALIGAQFGGDGRTTFALPNLFGAEPIPFTNYYIAMVGIFPSRQ